MPLCKKTHHIRCTLVKAFQCGVLKSDTHTRTTEWRPCEDFVNAWAELEGGAEHIPQTSTVLPLRDPGITESLSSCPAAGGPRGSPPFWTQQAI